MKIGIGEGTVDTGRRWLEEVNRKATSPRFAIAVDEPAVETGNRVSRGAIRSDGAEDASQAAS